MFVQLIRGRVSDPAAVEQRFERWQREVASGAIGWEGATFGVTPDGEFVSVVRFTSADHARRNSERPEQDAWWRDTEPLFDQVSFVDADEATTWLAGPSDEARFVQVMVGRVADEQAWRESQDATPELLREHRPDVLGGVVATSGERFVAAVYFRDEASAREGEAKEPPEHLRGQVDRFQSSMADVEFLDLPDPRHVRP